MAKRKQESAAATLDELQSMGDRLGIWVGENPVLVLGSGLAVLLVAGLVGLVGSHNQQTSDEVSAALAMTEADYRRAMGATAGQLGITEPANPETGRNVREEFIGRFAELVVEHAGTRGAAIASLQLAQLQRELGQSEAALATLEEAASQLDADDVVRALVLRQIAAVYEETGRWAEAAAAYQSASDVVQFPLRYSALADAARCYAVAGDVTQALAAYGRIETEASTARIPDHTRALLSELRARQ